MGRYTGLLPATPAVTSTNIVPVGGIATVLRSGDVYKAVGELVQRSIYTALSAAFPRNGSVSSVVAAPLFSSQVFGQVAFGNGILLMSNGVQSSTALPFAISYDLGLTWWPIAAPNNTTKAWIITFGNGIFVAINSISSTVYQSVDGRVWTNSGAMPSSQNWLNVSYGNGLFLALNDNGTPSLQCATSPDGITWTARTMPIFAVWSAAVFAAGKFVVVSSDGSGRAATSPDGITWTARTMPTGVYYNVVYGAGLFVAAGTNTGVCTSPDGITWTNKVTSYYPFSGTIAYGNGVFIGPSTVGNVIKYSIDGINWLDKRSVTLTTVPQLCTFANGAFVLTPGTLANTAAPTSLVTGVVYAENFTDSDYLYLSGTPGQFMRVK